MSSNQENLLRAVRQYQSSLDKYTENRNDGKLLHYLGKLYHLPVKVVHLEATGVGRTVNNLRKLGGQVGYSAKELVSKWKEMVVGEQEREEEEEEEEDDDDDEDEDGYQSGNDPSTDSDKEERTRESSSSHRKSDKRSDDKKHRSSSKSDGNDSSSSKRNGHTKHKAPKRKTDSESEEHESPKKRTKSEHKHRRPLDTDSEDEKKKAKHARSASKSKHKESSAKERHKSARKHDDEKRTKDKEKDRKSGDEKKEKKPKRVLPNNGIDSGSGASFGEALDMCAPSSSKTTKRKDKSTEKKDKPKSEQTVPKLLKDTSLEPPVDLNLSSLLPTITPNYRPLGNLLSSDQLHKKSISDYEALSTIMTSKNQRTKVYSGNKSGSGKVPSLFELCSRVLQDNIDALEYTGGVPYSVLKAILEKSSPNQLYTMEHHNPYLIADTDELWKVHCQKEFRNKKREEMETWREMYMRCLDERDAKLKALTANIKQSQDKSLPVRMTKLAYVDAVAKPPRNIARKQAKNGTAFEKRPAMTPAARLSALATAGEAGKVAVPNPGSRAAERSGHHHNVKPKKAPLMLKSISSFKNRFKR